MKRNIATLTTASVLSFSVVAMALMVPVQAEAASGIIKLSNNKTYKKYDITGDKKKDIIKVKTVSYSSGSDYNKKLTVYVNGKNCLVKKYSSNVKLTIKLIRLKNKKPYLYINALNRDGTYNSGNIYKYKSSKLKSALNLTKLVGKVTSYWDDYAWDGNGAKEVGLLSACLKKVSGNSIYIRIKHSGGEFNAGDEVYRYNYKNGKLRMHKTFPLIVSKMTIDLEFNKEFGDTGEQTWPFLSTDGKANEGSVIPVKVSSSNATVATASRDGHMGAGFSLRLKAYKKGTTIITITAADGRKAKFKLIVK